MVCPKRQDVNPAPRPFGHGIGGYLVSPCRHSSVGFCPRLLWWYWVNQCAGERWTPGTRSELAIRDGRRYAVVMEDPNEVSLVSLAVIAVAIAVAMMGYLVTNSPELNGSAAAAAGAETYR